MKKNVAGQSVGCQMITAADGSAFTGAVTVFVTGDNGVQAVGSVGAGACTHEGNGYHSYAPAQAETNYDNVAFTFTGTGAIPGTVEIYTSFPQTGDVYPLVDTEVAAIKAKTDQLTFTTANKVDSTIQAAGDFAQGAADKVWASAARTLTAFGFSVTVGTNNDKTGYALSAAGVQAIWDALTTALTTVGSIGKRLADDIDATISSRAASASLPANFSAMSITAGGLVDITQAAADKVWSTAVRALTDKSNFGINSVAAGTLTTAAFAVGAIDNTVIAANANTAIANAVLAAIIEGSITLKQGMQICMAAAAGKLSGAATATVTIRNAADTVNAIVATTDVDGNRTAVTLTFT